jgi:hypothetical protein
MLPYNELVNVPPAAGLLLVDTIDNRDMIIDNLLGRIHGKYGKLSGENKQLSDENKKLRDTLEILEKQNQKYSRSLNPSSGSLHGPGSVSSGPHPGPHVVIEDIYSRIIPEKTQVCKTFENRNDTTPYVESVAKIDPTKNDFLKVYKEIFPLMAKEGNSVNFPSVRVQNVSDVSAEESLDFTASTLDDNSDISDISDASIAIDTKETDTGYRQKIKKHMGSLNSILTEFVSESVQVEKILNRLNIIVHSMNKDDKFINYITNIITKSSQIEIINTDDDTLEGITFEKSNFNETEHKISIGIIFKGGNVYKLTTKALGNYLVPNVFRNYLTEMNKYFKKSDCDFSLVFVVEHRTNKTRYFALINGSAPDIEHMICTIQYIILNKYRNDFLKKPDSFDYLTLCGSNNDFMKYRMAKIAKKMMNSIIENRIEYEKKMLILLRTEYEFINNNDVINNYLNAPSHTFSNGTDGYISLYHTLKNNDVLKNCKNTSKGGSDLVFSIVDWLALFLYYGLEAKFFENEFPGRMIKPPIIGDDIKTRIKKIETSNASPAEIKTLYKVKSITHLLIGDKVYCLNNSSLTDRIIYDKVVNDHREINSIDKLTINMKNRLKALGRLHSNRNDFHIKITDSVSPRSGSGVSIKATNMLHKKIPFSLTKNGKPRDFATPFYISINKRIKHKTIIIQKKENESKWISAYERFAKYGSSGDSEEFGELPTNKTYRVAGAKVLNQHGELHNNGGNDTTNFGLSRLMLSFGAIFEEKDEDENNKYFVLPLAAEYIDLAFSYSSDIRTFMLETYDNYFIFSNSGVDSVREKVRIVKDRFMKTINDEQKETKENAANAFKKNDYRFFNRDHYKGLGTRLADIIRAELDCENYITICKDNPYLTIKAFFNLVIFLDDSDSNQSINTKIDYSAIYFPKLSTYILDIHSILFSESDFPWEETKYIKRLHRYIFFVFIESLRSINSNNISHILYDLGVGRSTSGYDNPEANDTMLFAETEEKRKKEKSNDGESIEPGRNEQFHEYLKSYGEQFKSQNGTFKQMFEYFHGRHHGSTVDIADASTPKILDGDEITACGIDHFMYVYHLLDFFPLTSSGKRVVFIKKIYGDVDSYQLIMIKNRDDLLANQMKEIIKRRYIPKQENILENVENNTYGMEIEVSYVQLNPNTNDLDIVDMFNYIQTVDKIREKLIMTVMNYKNELNLSHNQNIMDRDVTNMILNTYEGDIDHFLNN